MSRKPSVVLVKFAHRETSLGNEENSLALANLAFYRFGPGLAAIGQWLSADNRLYRP